MTNSLTPSLAAAPELGRWISLERQGFIAFRTGKVELGQGIETALAQIVAHELGVDLSRVVPLQVDTDNAPNEGVTAGSLSVEISGRSLRLAAAQAHSALIAAAATRLSTTPPELSLSDGGFKLNGTLTDLTIWAVSADVDWSQHVTGEVDPSAGGNIIGTSPARPDLSGKYRGGGFIHDLILPEMIHARVIRQPTRLARLVSVDEDFLARRYTGLSLYRRADFVAVMGPDEASVSRAHDEADRFTRWSDEPSRRTTMPPVQTENIGDTYSDTVEMTYEATFSRPNIAHASIGPSCALAQFADGRLTVWTHSQGIFELRKTIAICLDMDEADLLLIHAHGSGCYGHNAADDVALDAAILAMAKPGTPVRVQWSRQDELSKGPVGAGMSHRIRAALVDGKVAALYSEIDSQPHAQRPGNGGFLNLTSAEALDPARIPTHVSDLPLTRGGGASRNAVSFYDIPHQAIVRVDATSRIRTSALRSLGAHLNIYAIESAMDDLADQAEADPLDFRLAHLSDLRAKAVLAKAADMSGWVDAAGSEDRGFGLAVGRYKNKGAWLAAVAEVSVTEEVSVSRLWLCCDAGVLINPEGARSQIEGGAIQAISWTLKEAVPITDGVIAPYDWEKYPILRFSEVPRIETEFIVDQSASPLGAGEAAQGPVAAAIGNAVARVLQKRIHHLPLSRERIMAALLADE
ncbi:molybdopterin cofactor-binding domain-containing protein [Flavimaricola marinus]|uniref:Nicotinate dehydrogenase subunit B n=1 Tax=Flavimaricola marinus TaxID=1819565 RepID=A0A238LFH2_9RHOB|nr:molybdopterin cofactor-binding domain-containing protein [Flavimaricola marinus]SMY07696.1 Nicotinate dehydrogenase subunit B [Flavimaricola marinus]